MNAKQFENYRRSIRKRFPRAIAIRGPGALERYEDAVTNFASDGDRDDLVTQLTALGMSRADVRWHSAHPGERRQCVEGA